MAEQKKDQEKGSMTVQEAGRLGGEKGGQRERELVQKGHEAEEGSGGGEQEQSSGKKSSR
ncbi:hypothetical protein [Polyangium jinanense]|uniref:Em GEA1 (EM1) n=1 Tax=Polyangium jinanense TaxID=2829994 RepID=A0A9X3X4Z8_9BACT|nr:hypothetical protein [Polyangium jinanense]MDC3955651.1 hypothetical protein [Polyangium jinanense]MDC3982293.1 hypothetical protein [Polyangium jinanense]